MSPDQKMRWLKVFLRVYGWVSIALFGSLMLGFILRLPMLDEGAGMHWVIWDSVGGHVGPMLFIIYLTWGVFFLRAARNPLAYGSFLDFTLWANLLHGLLMVPQAMGWFGMAMHPGEYHSKFMTDIPYILGIAAGIYFLRPDADVRDSVTHQTGL